MSGPRLVAIVQARVGSTRLPGKTLLLVHGMSVLALGLRRLQRAQLLTAVTVATGDTRRDDPLAAECARLGVPCFRGSESDVLARYAAAAAAQNADHVVRVTADCPLICPELIDEGVRRHLAAGAAFTSNNLTRSFVHGVDFQIMTRAALATAQRECADVYEREHVVEFTERRPQRFPACALADAEDHSGLRCTLDTIDDYGRLHELCRRLPDPLTATYAELVAALLKIDA